MDNISSWGNIVKKGNLSWPDENIIRFMNKSFSKKGREEVCVLDFGCGAGRHSLALALEGFRVIAMDCSEEAIKSTRDKCVQQANNIEIIQNNLLQIPLENESIDAIIASGSMFLTDYNGRKSILEEMYRCMKPGAVFWSDWRGSDDWLYGQGEVDDEKSFILNIDGDDRDGLYYYFSTPNDLKALYEMCGFTIYNMEKLDLWQKNMSKRNSWYHVFAKK